MKRHPIKCIASLIIFLTLVTFGPRLHAGWGSIRASNRSAAPAQTAPRPQPQVHQSQPVTHPEPHQAAEPAREQTRPVEHFQTPAKVEQARADQADRQRMDIAPERSQSSFWSNYRPGMRIDRLPDGFHRIAVRGHPYFYFEGLFYDEGPSGYIIIAPPIDAEIAELPPAVETVLLGDTVYYYAAGAFYIQQADGSYIVVAPPMGVTVSMLPPDAVAVVFNGATYYQADGIYYLPVMQNGVVVYLTVPQP